MCWFACVSFGSSGSFSMCLSCDTIDLLIELLSERVWSFIPNFRILANTGTKIKHTAYHSWQLAFRNPADFMCEIRTKSAGFQVKSVWNPPDFTWNPYKICWISPEIRLISWNPYEICQISPEIRTKSAGFHECELLRDDQV